MQEGKKQPSGAYNAACCYKKNTQKLEMGRGGEGWWDGGGRGRGGLEEEVVKPAALKRR